MNKGFTLIELLAVIVILAVISSIGYAGTMAVSNAINSYLWNSNVSLIETAAENYGMDHKNILTSSYKTGCSVDGTYYDDCIVTTVQYLIDKGYITTKNKDSSGNGVIANDTLDESDPDYYVNDTNVCIYLDSNNVYSNYLDCNT